jgi:hypothetical protein
VQSPSHPPLLELAQTAATLTANQRVAPSAERLAADDARPLGKRVRGAVLSTAPLVVTLDVILVVGSPLPRRLGMAATAPESKPQE